MKLTKEQQYAIDTIPTVSGDFSIRAVPGSGKTFTLRKLSFAMDAGLSIAFTNNTVDELKAKFDSRWDISTAHKLGNGLLNTYIKTNIDKPFWKITNAKYDNIIHKILVNEYDFPDIYRGTHTAEEKSLFYSYLNSVRWLVDFSRLTMTDINNNFKVQQLIRFYGKSLIDEHVEIARKALLKGVSNFKWKGFRDFTDLLWMPLELNLQPINKYSIVMVDELQDLNLAQHNLINLFREDKIIGVGDPLQSMFGFAGSDSKSFELFNESFNCTELPLSYCFRCPASHIEFVKNLGLNDQIITSPTNTTDGHIHYLDYEDLADELRPGDCVISRIGKYQKDKPSLVSLMKELVQLNKSVKLVGYNPISDIIRIVKMADVSFDNFNYNLLQWLEDTKIQLLDEENYDKTYIKELEEDVNTTIEFYNLIQPTNLNEFKSKLEKLCNGDNPIYLMTIHKAKGTEWDNLYILNYSDMPMQYIDQQPWEFQQELNILHVALTRSMKNLTLVI